MFALIALIDCIDSAVTRGREGLGSMNNLLLQKQFAKASHASYNHHDDVDDNDVDGLTPSSKYVLSSVENTAPEGDGDDHNIMSLQRSTPRSTSRSRSTTNNIPGYFSSPGTVVSSDRGTPSLRKKTQTSAANPASTGSSAPLITRHGIPDTASHQKVLSLQRLLHYSGGPSLLLYDGKMIVQASGRHLVLVDVEGKAEVEINRAAVGNAGLWRAFGNQTSGVGVKDDLGELSSQLSVEGYRQAFLKGHSRTIGLLEVRSLVHDF